MSKNLMRKETISELGLAMHMYKRGKKKYLLRIYQFDNTGFTWSTRDIFLGFGAVKATAVAKVYWDLEKIKKGG